MSLDFRVSDYKSVPSQTRHNERTCIGFESEYEINSTWTIDAELLFTDN